MDQRNEFLIPSPLDGETLQQYLLRFTDEQLQQIIGDTELRIKFCSRLYDIESKRSTDNKYIESCFEKLWTVIQKVNNFDRISQLTQQLEPTRRNLLEALQKSADEIERVFTLCNAGRLVGSAFDIIGTVAGLWMKDSRPGVANMAFTTATAFGLLGFFSTLSEMNILKKTLNDLMSLIREDQDLFASIQEWYKQNDELEEAIQTIFPFDLTNDLVVEFDDLSNSEMTPLKLLNELIRLTAMNNFHLLKNGDLIRKLVFFTLNPESQNWLEWIIIRRHSVFWDIGRIILQLRSNPLDSPFIYCQSIPALAVGDQNIRSLPVWGRIGLNFMSMIHSIRSLRNSEIPLIVSEIRKFRRRLSLELSALQRIVRFLQMRRDQP